MLTNDNKDMEEEDDMVNVREGRTLESIWADIVEISTFWREEQEYAAAGYNLKRAAIAGAAAERFEGMLRRKRLEV